MTTKGSVKGEVVLQRIGGVGLILGGVLTIVGNILAPRPDDPSSAASYVQVFATSAERTRLAFFLIVIGLWALVAGMAAVYRSITEGAGAAWARLGYYGVLAATALFSAAFGVGLASIRVAAGGASDAPLATALATATDSLFGVSMLAYWLALLFVGIGIATSAVYPKWTGWLFIVSGAVAAVVGGGFRIFEGTTRGSEIVFGIAALVSAAVSLVLGVLITRREMKAM